MSGASLPGETSGPRSGPRPERSLEATLGRLLLAGVVFASAILLVGLATALATGLDTWGLSSPSTFPDWGTAAGLGAALLFAGVIVLVFTPVLRVAVALGLFARARDARFVAVTLVVFLLLTITTVVGIYR